MTESTDSTSTSGARRRAENLQQRWREGGKQKIESGKRAAADQIEDLAEAIGAAGAQLDQSQPKLAGYASKLADEVGGLAAHLRDDSIEDLYYQLRRLALRHPGMFLLGSAALGVTIARFMKASGEQDLDAAYTDLDEADPKQRGSFYRASATPDSYGARGM
jgi:hypothetical protein